MNNLKIWIILLLFAVVCCELGSISAMSQPTALSQLPQPQEKTLTIGQQYTFKVKPKTSIIIMINSTTVQKDILLDYISTFPFQTCILASNGQCQQQTSHHKTHQGSIEIVDNQSFNGIKITNPHETLFIKLFLRFHEITNGCHPLTAKSLYRKQLKDNLCLIHNIEEDKDMEIMMQAEGLKVFTYQFQICSKDKILKQSHPNRYLVTSAIIAQSCNGVKEKDITIKISNDHKEKAYINIVLQYPQEAVLLIDGVGYTTTAKVSSPKLFFYELVNQINTIINVQSKQSIKIYAKIVQEQFVEDTVPTQQDHHFSSKSGIIFTYFDPYLKITSEEILKLGCQNCYLVVSVVLQSKSSSAVQQQITVEVVQHQSLLVNGIMKHKFLPANSTAYYRYESDRQKIIYAQLSDNNQYCCKIYFSDRQNPSQLNHILKYQKKQIIYEVKQNQNYYIGVEAISNCAYSIAIYDSTSNITYLQKGRFGFLNLQPGQSKIYLIMSQNSKYLKFISIHVYGSVEIYLNRTTLQEINNLKTYDFKFSQFEKKGQYSNRLILQREQDIFCERCYYLVAVVATKHTESTLFYGDQTTPIPIRDKQINDFIPKKGTIVKGQYYGQVASSIQLRVKSGKLRLNFHNQKKQYQQIFNTSKQPYNDKFNLQIKGQHLFDQIISMLTSAPLQVQFEALEDNTIYSLKMTQIQQEAQNKQTSAIKYKNVSITPGDQQYQQIFPGQILCISGHLRDKNQKIILTSDYSNRQSLSLLLIQGQINSKKVEVKVEKTQNILSLSLPSLSNYLMKQALLYDIFISVNNTRVYVYIIQEEQFSILPSEVDVLINKQYTFITHIRSDLIIDIFQCSSSQSSITYGSTRKELEKKEKKELALARISSQPHAVRVTTYFTTFFRIKAEKAMIRWFPFDIEKKIGTGYIDYQVGHLIYKPLLSGIELNWKSLSVIKKTTSKIVNISYNLFISSDQAQIKTASQCEIKEEMDIYRQDNIVKLAQVLKLNTNHSFILNKNILSKKFGTKAVFITIVADVQVQPIANLTDQTERYRFLYPVIEIPEEMIGASYMDAVTNLNLSQLIVLILVGILLIITILYIVLMKLLPLLGILKNRLLVEEDEVQPKVGSEAQDGLTEVPPSSDRKGTNYNNEIIEKDEYIQVK